jgi:hypothetical protein
MNTYTITTWDRARTLHVLDDDATAIKVATERLDGWRQPGDRVIASPDPEISGRIIVEVLDEDGQRTDAEAIIRRHDLPKVVASGFAPHEVRHFVAAPTNATKVIRYNRQADSTYVLLCKVSGGATWATHLANSDGAYHGHYFNTYEAALIDYNERLAR